MEFSVKKRINRILENTNRIPELAGLSDPEIGYVAPKEAYEDDFMGLQKRFGNNIINKIELFVQNKLNEQMTIQELSADKITLNVQTKPTQNTFDSTVPSNTRQIFVKFGGYMHDSKNYVFNVGYNDDKDQEIFNYRFYMELNGEMNNWEKTIR